MVEDMLVKNVQKKYAKRYEGRYNSEEHKKHKRDLYKLNPDVYRRRYMRTHYNITLEQYDQIFEEQQGYCAICGKSETTKMNNVIKRLAVDHNHKTGQIRGLLCQRCNQIIGLAQESIQILDSAKNYLLEDKNNGV